jgi:hypothetical protein
MPVYARYGARVAVYTRPVQSTDEMDLAQAAILAFDDRYAGFASSSLGAMVDL